MSYSFGVRAATKEAAVAAVSAKLDEVVASQPDHAADRAQAQSAAEAFIALLADDASRDVVVSVSGWLSWDTTTRFTDANVSVSANLASKEPAAS